MGQNLQRHILEGAGGTVPQLQNMDAFLQLPQRRDLRRAEMLRRISGGRAGGHLLPGKIRQIFSQYGVGALRIREAGQRLDFLHRQRGNGGGDKQPALRGNPAGNRLGGGNGRLIVSCAGIRHFLLPPIFRRNPPKAAASILNHLFRLVKADEKNRCNY